MPDANAYNDWIGRTRSAEDIVSTRLIEGFRATLDGYLAPEAVPPGLFWCLAPDVARQDQLGDDGHPQVGLFLPPVPYSRRMWAGGAVTFRKRLSPGDAVRRETTITSIAFKEGRTGKLAFVTVEHRLTVEGELCIKERQDIVYREAGSAAEPASAPEWPDADRVIVTATPILLFRYSALTFNGHRIHYDADYARNIEGYPGLVVHGPLQATLILNLVTQRLGRLPLSFRYRGLAPLICGDSFAVEVGAKGSTLEGRVLNGAGSATFVAEIE